MSKGTLNKVILIGNLGADPETRYTPSNMAITKIRLATSESWKDKSSGEAQERTEWHRVTLFGRTGEVAQQYLRKGSKVYIEGQLRTNKWQGQDGQDRYTTEVIADQMMMLDSRGAGGGTSAPYDSQGGGQPRQAGGDDWGNDGFGGKPTGNAGSSGGGAPASVDFDDDIPF
ncbi:MAG: single-stranded DNA-binding protein [Chromatiaceae bacterium]